jgi:hypothetical protein
MKLEIQQIFRTPHTQTTQMNAELHLIAIQTPHATSLCG